MGRSSRERRRHRSWPEELKREIVAATLEPGSSIAVVARRYDVNANQVFAWRKRYRRPVSRDWLRDVAIEMDQEDGLIWVYGPDDDGVMAFTDFGIETLTGLIEIYKTDPDLRKRSTDQK